MEENRYYVELLGTRVTYFEWNESDIYLPMLVGPLQSDREGDHLLGIF